MEILTKIYDKRIDSYNMYIRSTYGEYLEFAKNVIKNNEFQRKRVKTSKTVYSLLKNDLQRGCIMPPLVLAIINNTHGDFSDGNELLEYISKNSNDVMILDGLQRTYTLIDAEHEIENKDSREYDEFLGNQLILEIYMNINKFGILYRMLTLNTGQTPMSARHQLEMLYSDMINTEIDGVELISDNAGKADPDDNQFVFKNAIEGFNSYMNRNELPIDRQELLDNIKMLENMSDELSSNDIFKEFLEGYIKVFSALRNITDDHVITNEELQEYSISESPFGKKASKIFSTSQALTGYGSAVGKMKDNGIITSISDIERKIDELKEKNDGSEWMLELLKKMDIIKNSSKKIGNAQRMFFHYFFRELFNKESDSYLNLEEAVQNGYQKYYSQVL